MNLQVSKDEIVNQIKSDLQASNVFVNHRWSPLSKIFTITRVFGKAIFDFVQSNLQPLYNAIFPHLAGELDLVQHLTRLGLSWKEATKARHRLLIGALELPVVDVEIPQGLLVFTLGADESKRVYFQTLDSVFLRSTTPLVDGRYAVEVTVECLLDGVVGNVAQNSISEIDNAPDGISLCLNPDVDPLVAGDSRESIESVRNRIQIYESGLNSKWTPNWYLSKCLDFAFVKRASFVSSKKLGRPGIVNLLLIGSGYSPVSDVNLTLLEDFFNGEDQNPGGSAFVECFNATIQSVDKTINVFFADADSVLSAGDLQNVVDSFFFGLQDGNDVLDADLKFRFYSLPRVINVSLSPIGDVSVPDGTIAVPGVIVINALVYS